MKTLTFPGGIHPKYNKGISIREPLREGPLSDEFIVPLSQHIGAPNTSLVVKSDKVEEGQMIGKSDSFVSSPVHSPVTGEVVEVKKVFHPSLGPTMSVIIKRDADAVPRKYSENDVESLTIDSYKEKIKNAGLVGMGGAAFPTHVKLSVPEGKNIHTLIVNGAECEPYLTCDHVIMTRKPTEVLKGIEIVAKILKPKNIIIGIEENKKAAIFALGKAMKDLKSRYLKDVKIVPLRTKYPQGGEKQLIKAIAKKEVPPGKLPLDIGFLVQNVGTLYAIYEAVYYDKPLTQRIVTVSGDAMHRPGNFLVKVGTPLKDIAENFGIELYKEVAKIIVGGPMMGFAQPVMEAPVLKSTSGILFLSKKSAKYFEETECVKCAKCIDVCPVNLLPTEIMKNAKKGFWEETNNLFASDCMECGACAYICPARIPLVQYIKMSKAENNKK